jgi:hypothetical protein
MAKFRAVKEEDRSEIETWIAADPGHAGKMTADFFLEAGKTHSLYAVGDEEGTAMYIRCELSGPYRMRAHIQFGPDKKRIMKCFRDGWPLVMDDAKKRGFKSVLFDSTSPTLVKWMMSEFKFKAECEAII